MRYSTAPPAAALGSRPTMIKAILIFNNHGKPRLSKFYQRYVRAGRGSAGRAEAGRWPGGGVVREVLRPSPVLPSRWAQGSAVGKGTALRPCT